MFRPSTGSGPELVEGILKNLVNRACREPLGRTINPVKKLPPQAAKFMNTVLLMKLFVKRQGYFSLQIYMLCCIKLEIYDEIKIRRGES